MNNIAIIRIRGRTGVNGKVNDTLDMMRLYKQNGCVIVPNNPVYLGMIHRAKDYITWGEIDKETFTLLFTKRARVAGNKALTDTYLKEHLKMDAKTFIEEFFGQKKKLKDIPGLKPYFRLSPPNKGFERCGIKKPYTAINIRDLNVLIAKHSLKGEINLKKYGYGKLLSTGELHTAIKITVKRASKQCIEKVKNAGGSIVVENSKE